MVPGKKNCNCTLNLSSRLLSLNVDGHETYHPTTISGLPVCFNMSNIFACKLQLPNGLNEEQFKEKEVQGPGKLDQPPRQRPQFQTVASQTHQ